MFKAGKTKAINTSSLQTLGQSTVDLAKYAEDEFAQVASSLQGDDPFRVNFVAPVKPRQGMLVYADGTKWNPGSGEGFYEYSSGAVWVPLTMSEALFQAFLNASPASATTFGAVKVDNTTIKSTAGVISTIAPAVTPPVVKAAVYFKVVTGTVTVLKAFNVTSVVRVSAGAFTVNFTAAFPDTNYFASLSMDNGGATNAWGNLNNSKTISSCAIAFLSSTSVAVDPPFGYAVFFE